MDIIKLRATNFISFAEVEYDFLQGEAIPIQGINLTEEDQESNGSGKTVLQNIVEYCYIASTSRGSIRDLKLIRRGQEDATVFLETFCPVRNQILTIERTIRTKGSSLLSVSINNIEQEFATVNDGNSFILNWLDMTREDILNYYIINKYKYESFFTAANTRKLDLISRFSNSKLVEGADKRVEADVAILQFELDKITHAEIPAVQGKIDVLHEQIDFEKNRDLEAEKVELIDGMLDKMSEETENAISYSQQITLSNSTITSLSGEVTDIEEKIKDASESLTKFGVIDFTKRYKALQDLIQQKKDSGKVHSDQKKELSIMTLELESRLIQINRALAGVITCPKCNFQFVEDPNVDVKQLKIQIPIINQDLHYLNLEIDSYDVNITGINNKISELFVEIDQVQGQESKQHKEIQLLKDNLRAVTNSRETLLEKIEAERRRVVVTERYLSEKEEKISNLEKSINEVQDLEIDLKRISEYENQITELAKKMTVAQLAAEKLETEIFNLKQWVFNFKKFYQYLANQSLKVIQGHANKYLKTFRSEMQILIEGFKVKADGNIKEAVTPIILYDNEECDFKEFSGGERARLEFSIILALQEILNSTNKWGGLNIVWTDEVTESLDYKGLELIMKSLKETGKTVLMTTHVSNSIEGALVIEKKLGISEIVMNGK